MSEERESPPPPEPDEGSDGDPAEAQGSGAVEAEAAPSPPARKSSGEVMIEAEGLTKYYGHRAAIKDLSFTIDRGEIVGFLGLNGAGKTTALRVLSCLLVPTSGRVTVAGIDVLENPHEIRRRIGYLPEVPPVYHEMTVAAYLDFAARLRGLSGPAVAKRVSAVLDITSTRDVSQQVIGTLSAGYRQRVGIAQAVVHEPDLLILDEPFAGLDPVQTVEMREMIRRLGGEHTVLLSSHLLSQIHETCDRILVIQRGRIVAQGTEEELASRLPARAERFSVEVRGAAADVTEAVESVEGIESQELVELEGGLARVTITSNRDLREEVVVALVHKEIGVRTLGRLMPELETVFVELARGDGKEASP